MRSSDGKSRLPPYARTKQVRQRIRRGGRRHNGELWVKCEEKSEFVFSSRSPEPAFKPASLCLLLSPGFATCLGETLFA